MELLGINVKATYRKHNTEIIGKVVDVTEDGKYLLIENEDDCFEINNETWNIEEIIEEEAKYSDNIECPIEKQFVEFMENDGYNWEAYGDNHSTHYIVNGNDYKVEVFIDMECSDISFNTIHKGRLYAEHQKLSDEQDFDKVYANYLTRKNIKSIINQCRKWLEV